MINQRDAFEKFYSKLYGERSLSSWNGEGYHLATVDFAYQVWQAAIEEYKASLVPVAYIHRNEYDEYRLEPLDTFKVKDVPKNVDTKLYALGETK